MPRAGAASLVVLAILIAPGFLADRGSAATGGPDSYGYVWVDSQPPSPIIQYAWIEIIPQAVRLTLPDDGCTFEVSLGFQFRYYGTIAENVFVCSNGFLAFGVPDSFYPDPPIPDPGIPNNRIVGLGVDLNPAASGSGGIYVLSQPGSLPRRFIITWNGVYKAYTQQRQTFQIVLEQNSTSRDGRILFQYKTLTGVTSALVGIENGTGTSGLAYPGTLGNGLAVAFLPPSDATLPPDVLSVGAASIAPPAVTQGSANVPMMRLDFSTPTNDVAVTAVQVTLSGLRAGPEDVASVRAWVDDGDGSFSDASDFLRASATFSGFPPRATLRPTAPISVSMALPARVFLTYNLQSGAGVGDWIGARLDGAGSVSVAYPDSVSPTGFPFDTYVAGVRTRIDASQDTLSLAQVSSNIPASAPQWETDVPAISLELSADRNFVVLAGMRVGILGDATAPDIWAVKLIRDLDRDAGYTPGTDEVLAIAAPAGAPLAAMLTFNLTVAAGGPQPLLVLLDLGPRATVGAVLRVRISDSDLILAAGSVDRISPTNFPATSEDATIVTGARPSLVLPWSELPPPEANGIWRDGEYLLDPEGTAIVDRPAGNGVPGFVTAENNGWGLFVAIDVTHDTTVEPTDSVAIAFDTGGDEAPTPGGDDVYVFTDAGGSRLLYNATAAGWTVVSTCTSGPGSPTTPACARGFSGTGLRTTPHRYYEFVIPLALLEVPSPTPPGTVIRFALAGPSPFGLVDGGNRSTWPLLFSPADPPLWAFGELLLSPGPPPNRAPVLNWTGEPGYETDGLEPETGFTNTTFEWRIVYVDPDGDPPALGSPHLHIARNGVELPTSPYAMVPVDPKGANYAVGAPFFLDLAMLPCGGSYTYTVTVRDAHGLEALTPIRVGPQIRCPDQPPILSDESVAPFVATAGSSFRYQVLYTDREGLAPTFVRVSVRHGEEDLGFMDLSFSGWWGPPGDYTQGAWYEASRVLSTPGLNYSYMFNASDGNATVYSPFILGPYVLPPPPDVLTVTGYDLGQIVVDEGARFVPYLQVLLRTSSPSVDVTALRVDRVGSATDAAVDSVLLYWDADRSGTISEGDVLLGSRQPTLGSLTFPFSLQVTPAASVSLLLFANVTRPGVADDTLGLEIKDRTYVSVGSGDVVQSFPPIRSTRTLINVPPYVVDPSVNGFLGGSRGIMHVIGTNPTLSWRYDDPNGADVSQVAFNVSVSMTAPATLLWFRNETGAVSSVVYGGPPLAEGASYAMRVSLSDGRLWSSAATVPFRVNTPPPKPGLSSPGDGTNGLGPNVTLLWQPVTDLDGDPITYTFWVSQDAGFTAPIVGVTIGTGTVAALTPGTTYYWRVGASDGFQFAGNATTWQFATVPGSPPLRGEILGRVLHSGTPHAGALVEVLLDGTVAAAMITDTNGTFHFRALDFSPYVVRVSAFDFTTRTVPAEPTSVTPVVDLHDIELERGAPGPTNPQEIPLWIVAVIVALLGVTGVSSGLAIASARKRRHLEKRPKR